MRIALLTRSYPADGDLYKYPFVHRRVKAYVAAGHDVRVLRLGEVQGSHLFDGIECRTVNAARFAGEVAAFAPDVIAAHGPDDVQWPALMALQGRWPICAWLHGSEIPGIQRVKASLVTDPEERAVAEALTERRAAFWRGTLADWPAALWLAFPSHNAALLMRQDIGAGVGEGRMAVLPNPIDTDLFRTRDKQAEDALHVLSIRPHDSWLYANDLAVQAVLHLQAHPRFAEMRFTFIGDGPLFDETFAPVRHLPNVNVRRTFLRQEEIAREHARHGVFLVPSRLDTQGVSRDEAMASGLAPVTTRVFAVPEFVDGNCAGLVEPEDAAGLASEIARMVDDPTLFLARSRAAAARVRAQSAHDHVIPRELAWMQGAVDAAR
ncbi:glycosyltransferase family 4 protein [Novosphingobium cyanobacteriorum]|uniref:Glycosyltransferase family 4 protein n=1 Tax=Novosphingobium cyanobacteriorum TaxID=3024215 RepID=A0ABT6CDU3_9SPHN|nr:glycosyltransferase family 4 protein [Novosphingobium cyanobacteriorum]MDF8332098.1 glycosyltransferase family 4 protein [Novosphingobium cyanobacteriorum]